MMNQTVTNQTSLEDFEEFDLRDAINVAVYGFMSLGELSWEKRPHYPSKGLTNSLLIVGMALNGLALVIAAKQSARFWPRRSSRKEILKQYKEKNQL